MSKSKKINPIRETSDEAKSLARKLLLQASFGSLSVLEPETGYPLVSRISIGVGAGVAADYTQPMFLASDLSAHTKSILKDSRASIMVGEPSYTDKGIKGDPLAFARMTIIGNVVQISRAHKSYKSRRAFWLKKHPKSQLYIDFADFNFYVLKIERILLNGGFGKAYQMHVDDLK